jgi:hypothetical protein
VLLAADEYPFHQITQTFAAAATSDPAWNDGHYVTAGDVDGQVAFVSNLRLYANNDVMDGFVCVRHRGRQYNVRVSRRLRPQMDRLVVGPLRLEIVRPLEEVRLVLEPCRIAGATISLDVTCRTVTSPYVGPVEVSRHAGRLVSERMTYELAGPCDGTIEVDGERIDWTSGQAHFFRNHSWGVHPGRGGPRTAGAPSPSRRAPGVRHWVLFDVGDHSGFFFVDPSGRAAAGKGAILEPDRVVPIVEVQTDVALYEPHARLRTASFRLTDVEGRVREYECEDLGWLYCQGGGYFGGFDDGLGQGVYRGDEYAEGETWDVSHPVDVVTASGVRRFDHDWAESFVRVRHGDAVGLAHYECVDVRPSTGS